MDASHVAVAGSVELSGHAGAAGDTSDIDDPASPFTSPAGGFACQISQLTFMPCYGHARDQKLRH